MTARPGAIEGDRVGFDPAPDGCGARLPTMQGVRGRWIREFRSADVEWLSAALAAPGMIERLYPQFRRAPTLARVIADWSGMPSGAGDFQWVLCNGGPEGVLGCVRVEDAQLSYFIDPRYQGLGHGRHLVSHVVTHLRHAAPNASFSACTERDNEASTRILERAGFRFDRLLRHDASSKTFLSYRLAT